MKYNLLEMVQMILSDIDSDEVNSIADTTEATQVASIIKEVFYEFLTRKEWPHLRKLTTLISVSDLDKPTWLLIPDNAVRLDYLAYNRKLEAADADRYTELTYLYPDEFIRKCNLRTTDNDNVVVATNDDGVKVHLLNDTPPTYWTSFDDQHIVLDSWVEEISSTVLGPESQAVLYYHPTWSMTDTFIPDLPAEAFAGLLAEAKSVTALDLVQAPNEKAEQQAKRQYNMLAQQGFVSKGGIRYPNYGRRSGKYRNYRSNHFPER